MLLPIGVGFFQLTLKSRFTMPCLTAIWIIVISELPLEKQSWTGLTIVNKKVLRNFANGNYKGYNEVQIHKYRVLSALSLHWYRLLYSKRFSCYKKIDLTHCIPPLTIYANNAHTPFWRNGRLSAPELVTIFSPCCVTYRFN